MTSQQEELLALNRRFGAAGRIAFREGPGGSPIVALVAPQGVCEVALHGGQVLSYRPLGHRDALWLSPLADFSEEAAIRGGIPVCWPWFGAAPAGFPAGSPAHGFARRALWRPIESEYSARETALTLELTQDDATSPAFPFAYQLKLTITLGDCLTLDLQTRNMADEVFTYGEALHAYLRVADARQATLVGATEAPQRFFDDRPQDDVLPKPDVVALLADPVMERTVALAADDSAAVVVWHPALEHTFVDMPLEGPRHFICVEPANPHHCNGQITLAPGEAHTLTLRLQCGPLKKDPAHD